MLQPNSRPHTFAEIRGIRPWAHTKESEQEFVNGLFVQLCDAIDARTKQDGVREISLPVFYLRLVSVKHGVETIEAVKA